MASWTADRHRYRSVYWPVCLSVNETDEEKRVLVEVSMRGSSLMIGRLLLLLLLLTS